MSQQAEVISAFRFEQPGFPPLFFKVIEGRVYLCTRKPGLDVDQAVSKAFQLENQFNPITFIAYLSQKRGLILALPPDFSRHDLIKAVFAFHQELKAESRPTHDASLGTLKI